MPVSGGAIMEYKLTEGAPITEADALQQAAEMGFHALAFDLTVEKDESLHWHEFDSVTWVIEGTGTALRGDNEKVELRPGCRIEAPAGFLHRALAGPPLRLVLATNLPYSEWTMPIDKDPADRPEHLSV
jgi:quercetin dioxygenase-like cupin family protein